jgi:putative transposase
MVEREHRVSISRQCQLLDVNRSTFYYTPRGESPYNLKLMKLIDQQYMQTPFYGVGQMTHHLRNEGHEVNHKRIRRLWRLMGLRACVPGPHTSRRHPHHKVYPYLLRDLPITHANQVWMCDITYLPVGRRGFFYLVAFIDVHSRYLLSWELSNSLDSDFCVRAFNRAVERWGKPEIVNTDQGSQFTSDAFTGALKTAGVRISMDGKGRAIDNVFIERFWRSLKVENIYLYDYENGHALERGVARYISFYNHERPHDAHNGLAPCHIYPHSKTKTKQTKPADNPPYLNPIPVRKAG